MRRFFRFLYHLTVGVLCVLIALNIVHNPAGFRSLMMRTVSQIGTVTGDALSGLFGAFADAGQGSSAISAADSADGSGQSGQPAPVQRGDTRSPSSADTAGSAASSSTDYWGDTAVSGLKVYEYGKSLLPAGAQQSCYDQIAAGIRNVNAKIVIHTSLDPVTVEKIVDYFLQDHAEVFYASSAGVAYTYSTWGSRTVYKSYTITPEYIYNKTTVMQMRARLGENAASFLAAAAEKDTAYQKELALHDTVIRKLSYDSPAASAPDKYPESFTAYGAFVNRKAVCEGYAKAMKLLLDSAGVESIYVTGTASNGAEAGPHAWNMVRLGSRWYYLDATFDDPVIATGGGRYVSSTRPDYTYFNYRQKANHVPGVFDSANPFSAASENYAVMPAV